LRFRFLVLGRQGVYKGRASGVPGAKKMTSVEFKRKWSRFSGKESAAYQEHFNDLCRLLGEQTPNEADPSGNEQAGIEEPRFFAEKLEELFRVMAKGGSFGLHRIRHFNGHLFEEATVFELTPEEIRMLADAAEADWQFIEPSIMGTLFERALDEGQRAQLGAHYTSETDIKTLVEPVLMQPLRRECGGWFHRHHQEGTSRHSREQSFSDVCGPVPKRAP
jgi:hypothetical protein